MKITEFIDKLFAIKINIYGEELVPIALNCFSAPYEAFVQDIYACEKLPIF